MEFGYLLCGRPEDDAFELKTILENLIIRLDLLTNKIIAYDWIRNSEKIEIPFYARNVLETALTAILSRVDPFRVITVYKVQSSQNYDIGKKSESAIQWTGDIIATKKDINLWDFNNKKDNFDRALLSNYQAEMIWQPAFMALLDYVESKDITSQWLDEIIGEDEKANFERCKAMASRLFSSFSKGVHSEALVDTSAMFDTVTLKSMIKDLYKLCAILGLVSHFIGYLVPNIPVEEAMNIFCETEAVINGI